MPSKRESITKVSNNQMWDTYWTRFSLLMSNQTSICDIIANLKNISMQKEQWGVTPTDKEKTFWENHKKKQPIRKSSSFFDCQWEIRWDKKEMWQKRKLWSKLWSGKRKIQMAVQNDTVCYNDKAEQEDQEFTVIKEPNYNERPAYSQNHSPITKS